MNRHLRRHPTHPLISIRYPIFGKNNNCQTRTKLKKTNYNISKSKGRRG